LLNTNDGRERTKESGIEEERRRQGREGEGANEGKEEGKDAVFVVCGT